MKNSVRTLTLSVFALAILSILFVLYLKIRVSPTPAKLPPAEILGRYSYDTSFGGFQLTLSTNGVYELHRYSSAGGSEQERSEGIYTIKEGKVKFTPNHSDQKPWEGYLIPWGQRTYFLKDGDFERFYRAIQRGEEPRKGGQSDDFALYNDKETTQPTGLPKFPQAWQHLLKDIRPITKGMEPGHAFLYREAKSAVILYKQGYLQDASRYALDVIQRSAYCEQGEASTHDVNIVLGAIALKSGKTQKAKEYLLQSAQSFPVRSSSPYQYLLEGLWRAGETDAVLTYIEALIKKEDDPERTANWKSSVQSGKVPALFVLDEN